MTYAEKCAKLAYHVVDTMDLKDLMRCMTEQLEQNYLEDVDSFQRDWEDYGMDE